jgi:hypothetical protein
VECDDSVTIIWQSDGDAGLSVQTTHSIDGPFVVISLDQSTTFVTLLGNRYGQNRF